MALFLYGTLLDDVLRDRIGGPGQGRALPAILADHRVVWQAGALVPLLQAYAGGAVAGLYLPDLTAAHNARFDAYEVPWGYTPLAVTVIVDGAAAVAEVYYPDPAIVASDRPFSLADWQDREGPVTREIGAEIAAMDPPLEGDALRAQWPMLARRAAARLRAGAGTGGREVRRRAGPGDLRLVRSRLSGNFFRFAQHTVHHRTFAGAMSPALEREVFVGTDAAILLPYDPAGDRVLLVEQFRMGPVVRGDAEPWILEPVAGMVDAGETPAQAALREAAEEAGLTDIRLQEMFSFYASPGSSTDYFHCYAGLCTLPEPTTYTGGLACEDEDLRLHVLPFDTAIGLIATGEANAGPLIAMLLWLQHNRNRLRTAAA